MGVYLVSYDLRKPGKDYQPLWNRLEDWKAVRLLESVWVINAAASVTAVQIRDDLLSRIDQNDGLLVAKLAGEAAWNNLQGSSGQTLKSWLEQK